MKSLLAFALIGLIGFAGTSSVAIQIVCSGSQPEKQTVLIHKTPAGRVGLVRGGVLRFDGQRSDITLLENPLLKADDPESLRAIESQLTVQWFDLHHLNSAPMEQGVIRADLSDQKLDLTLHSYRGLAFVTVRLKAEYQPKQKVFVGTLLDTQSITQWGGTPEIEVQCQLVPDSWYFEAKEAQVDAENAELAQKRAVYAAKQARQRQIAEDHTRVQPGYYAQLAKLHPLVDSFDPTKFFGGNVSSGRVIEVKTTRVEYNDTVVERRGCMKLESARIGIVYPDWDDNSDCTSFSPYFAVVTSYEPEGKFTHKDGSKVTAYSQNQKRIYDNKPSFMHREGRKRGNHWNWGGEAGGTRDSSFYEARSEAGEPMILKVDYLGNSLTYEVIEIP